MKKKYIVLGAFAAICAAAYYLTPSFESIVKKVVHKYGSEITGTDVNLQGFSLSLTNGEGAIQGLTVANSKGYKSPYIIDLGGVKVKVNLKSLTTDTIIIDEISVEKPVITYEMISLTQNNLKQLQENIAKNTASAIKTETADVQVKPTESAKKENKTTPKKVIIKVVNIKEGELKALTALQGQENSVNVKLPPIRITDIGGNKAGGESIAASISQILSTIIGTASQTVVNSNLGDLKNVAKDSLNNVVGGVKDRINSVGIFGK